MIIISTFGRTGSTLLMNILNNSKNITITGELYGYGFLRKLIDNEKILFEDLNISRFKSSNINRKYKLKVFSSINPFFVPRNCIFYNEYINNIRTNINKLNNKTEIIDYLLPNNKLKGMKIVLESKKIRYILENDEETKIILSIRNPEETYKSMQRCKIKISIGIIENEMEEYKKINKEYPKNTFLISYEEIIKNGLKIKELCKFLNIKFDNKKYKKSLKKICSYNTRF
jgi:hypothetical protein